MGVKGERRTDTPADQPGILLAIAMIYGSVAGEKDYGML